MHHPFRIASVISAIILALIIPHGRISAQSDPVAFHDLSEMRGWLLGKTLQLKGAMGQSGSFALAEMPAGARGPAGSPHHHVQEQIVLGVSGSTIISVGGTPYRLGSYGAVITPQNVEHFPINGATDSSSTFIEFQAVLRSDWFPPHLTYTAPKSPAPIAVARDQRVFGDLHPSSDGWSDAANGARSKKVAGQTIQVTLWDLSAPNALVDLVGPTGRVEQFAYILEGHVAAGSSRREIGPGMLVIVSAAGNVRLSSVSKGRTLIAVFEPTAP